MRQVSATRSELLARRAQIALARLGRDLLKERRDALKREFLHLSGTALVAMEALEESCAVAHSELSRAAVLEGPEAVASAALAAAAEVEVDLSARNVAGVSIVVVDKTPLQRRPTERGYSLGATSARIDRVAAAFESELDLLLDVIAAELSLRRLADAIALTTRRVNALESVVIPRIEAERDFIALVLEERQREDRIRLMRARRSASLRRAA